MATMKGRDEQSTDDMIRSLLRKMARLHFSKQSQTRKDEVQRIFTWRGESDDAAISLERFMESTEATIANASSAVVAKVFSFVDERKSGFLEFDDFLVFIFVMESGFQICARCLSPVVIAGYTCKTCWSEAGHDSYDLCATCYASESFDHPSRHEIVDTCHMYSDLFTSQVPPALDSEGKARCSICGEWHTKDISGLLVAGNNHVLEMEGSFVCEWCASYMCVRCGEFFCETKYQNLKRLQSLLEEDRWCGKCDKQEDCELDLDLLIERLRDTYIPEQCDLCSKLAKSYSFKRLIRPGKRVKKNESATSSNMDSPLYFHAASMRNAEAALARLA